MGRRFIYKDDGIVRRTMHVESADQFTVQTDMDCTELVDNNKLLSELHPVGSTNKLVARVPMTVYEKSLLEDWTEEQWKRWLNDPDNRAFRVWQGAV